jgi:hypothetical protein
MASSKILDIVMGENGDSEVLSDDKAKTNDFVSSEIEKESAKKTADSIDKSEVIKIVSKRIEHSHYHAYLALNDIMRDGKSWYMVSILLKDEYLGRYLVKRNYYFYPDNKDGARKCFYDLIDEMGGVRKSYYSDDIDIVNIQPEIRRITDNFKGDVNLEQDDLGTTVKRNSMSGHDPNGPHYIRDHQDWAEPDNVKTANSKKGFVKRGSLSDQKKKDVLSSCSQIFVGKEIDSVVANIDDLSAKKKKSDVLTVGSQIIVNGNVDLKAESFKGKGKKSDVLPSSGQIVLA